MSQKRTFGKMRGKLELRFLQNEEAVGFFVCLFVAFLLLIFLIPAAKKNEPRGCLAMGPSPKDALNQHFCRP